MKKLLPLIFLPFIFLNEAFSQLSFDHIYVSNGLSQSTVLSIFKDHRGYMWFGTRDRLNRYDARNIKIYNYSYNNPGSISCSDYVYSVFEDREKNLWIGTVKGINRYIPESDSFERIGNDSADQKSLSNNSVYCSYQDSKGNLWFGTNHGLNKLSSPTSRKFDRFFKATAVKPGLIGNQIYAIHEDRDKNLWVGSTEGLTEMIPKKGGYLFKKFSGSTPDANSLDGNFVKTIAEDKDGILWIGTETGGLNKLDPQTYTFTHFKHDPLNANSLSHNDIRKILIDKAGRLWLGTMNGLNVFNTGTQQFTHYEHDVESRASLSDNSIKDIYQDDEGTIWIGTMFGGINIIHPNTIPFTVYQASKFKNSISGNVVGAFVAEKSKNLWIATEGNGLNYYDKATSVFKHYVNSPNETGSIATNFVKALWYDKDNNLWVGLHQGGLDLFQPASGTFKHFRHSAADPHSISSDVVTCLYEDSFNRFWVGTSRGVDLFDKKHSFRNYLNYASKPLVLSSIYTRSIYEDSHHNIWVGTTGGLNLLRVGATTFTWFKAKERDEHSLHAGYINCVKEDNDGTIWVGSFHGGLSSYDPHTQTFKTYTTQMGLPSDNVLAIQPTEGHYLWISTDNGLAKFNTITKKFKNYTAKDGLPTNEFNYNSSFKDDRGNLYFGTYNGFISFSARQIKQNEIAPPVLFTGLKLFNQPVTIADKSNLLQEDISLTKQIVFTADQNVFSVDFTALNYDKPDRNQYAYRLVGFEKKWNYVSIPTATYTNLPAGDYDLLIKGSNNDGFWSTKPTSLHIVILPPLWKTWWAYLFYTIAFVGLLYLVIRFFGRQARLESDLYYEHLNYERQQEVHQMKLDFFTKVSHEIRTPLTLILAPVDKLIDITLDNPTVSRQLNYVKQNADRLLRLVNELLDFRKIETGHMKLHVSEHDIIKFCHDVFLSFERLSIVKNISYHFKPGAETLSVYFDPAQFEKVLFNILSNAFKFTPNEGTITLSVNGNAEWIEITIADNGAGIAKDLQSRIFENFYQAQNDTTSPGWGIGLALVKNIVDLHKGKVTVASEVATDSRPGKTVFTVSLSKGKSHFDTDNLDNGTPQDYEPQQIVAAPLAVNVEIETSNTEKQTILVVEDNTEVRGLIKESLAGLYEIHESANGAEGWEMGCRLIPDLIISDVTMPVMDGLELCSKIKSDERTNHIPVILLTAKAAYVHQISGLETGADAYVTKPFRMQMLELTIRNLIMARQAMRQKFAQQVTLMPKNKVIDLPDEKFLTKLMTIVETHMDNSEFDVIKLVKEIGMSQSILYRKVKALTDMNIADFIKSTRLKQAALMLAQNKLSISDVAYAVGFNDRKYFSKEFKKQFGKTPSEYMDQIGHDLQ